MLSLHEKTAKIVNLISSKFKTIHINKMPNVF